MVVELLDTNIQHWDHHISQLHLQCLLIWLLNCWTPLSGAGIIISPDTIFNTFDMVVELLDTNIWHWDHHIS
jgi:hypothetical protein